MGETVIAGGGAQDSLPAGPSGLAPDGAGPTGTVGTVGFTHDRFLGRARALFSARLAFLMLGLLAIALPASARTFGIGGSRTLLVYLAMVAYSAANQLWLGRRWGRALTLATLCADLSVLACLAAATGGLRSPFLAAQLVFTALFVLLFPSPLAALPPLLSFPAAAALEQLFFRGPRLSSVDAFLVLWYSAADCILVYALVHLSDRDLRKHRELRKESSAIAVAEERNRLSRDIHDGLGGVLSSVVIQSEYLLNLIDGSEVRARLSGTQEARLAILPTLRRELTDLHEAAEESMDELRRSLRMMREDFELVPALADACKVAGARHRLDVRFTRVGRERSVRPEAALAMFRVLQESLTNAAKHCGKGTVVEVTLTFTPGLASLAVQDRGPGFAQPAGDALSGESHYGLANMRERANKVRGRLRIDSAKGRGTRIELTVHAGEERHP